MPIFDFKCRRCGHEFESLIMKDGEQVQCPECGSESVTRKTIALFSCTGVSLTKQLKMESEERMTRSMEGMKKKS